MKKILATVLVLTMLFALAACGGGDKGGSTSDAGSGTSAPSETPSGGEVKPVNVVFYSANTGNAAEKALKVMVEQLETTSNGTLKGVLIDAGTAGYQDEAVQAMMAGDMNVIVNTVDMLENYVPNVGNWMSWPFLFDSDAEAQEIREMIDRYQSKRERDH